MEKTKCGIYGQVVIFGSYFILFYQGRIIEVWPLFTVLL